MQVILGQGTIAMELLEQIDVDNVVASVGGGGLLSGIVSCYRVTGDTQTKCVLLIYLFFFIFCFYSLSNNLFEMDYLVTHYCGVC